MMIKERFEYLYLTNRLIYILLYIPLNWPNTLYYFLYDPYSEMTLESNMASFLQRSFVTRVLYLYLIVFRLSSQRQEQKNQVYPFLYKQETSFNYIYLQILRQELQQIPHSNSTNPKFLSLDIGLSYSLLSLCLLPMLLESRQIPIQS